MFVCLCICEHCIVCMCSNRSYTQSILTWLTDVGGCHIEVTTVPGTLVTGGFFDLIRTSCSAIAASEHRFGDSVHEACVGGGQGTTRHPRFVHGGLLDLDVVVRGTLYQHWCAAQTVRHVVLHCGEEQ